jgi:hypothetical protein
VFWDFPIWLGKVWFNAVKAVFWDFPIWLVKAFKMAFVDFPIWLWNTTTKKMKQFGQWLWDNTIGKLIGLGDWIYDTFTTALQKVWDWFSGLIPGGAKTIGGMKDIITGGGEGRWAGVKKVGGGLMEGAKGVASKLNPFNWFGGGKEKVPSYAAGADIITRGGIALIHAGEEISPAKSKDLPMGEKAHAIPSIRTTETAKPKAPQDIHETILRDRVSTEADTNKNNGLFGIEKASNRQVDLLTEMASGIQELVSLLKPGPTSNVVGESPSEAADTKVYQRPRHSPQYGRWKYGKPGDSFNRKFVNTGQ